MVKSAKYPHVALLLGLGLGGCELGSTVIPRADPVLVVHSIIDPSLGTQYVLVEQSLSGRAPVIGSGDYDPNNPITSGNGVPVSGAAVTITGTGVPGVRFAETRIGSGVYFARVNGIRPGSQYSLAVSAQGMTVAGTTVVPVATRPVAVPLVRFNRDHDAVNLPISDVSLARAYWVRIDAPDSPYELFTLDRTIAIAGDVRNVFTQDFLKVFYPGFLQTMTVAAVDSNVYDYYRSGNDPFSGRGLINHLNGGLGVFGSMVIIDQRQFDITQDSVGDAIEGRFTLRSGPPAASTDNASQMTLFLEARGTGADAPDRISGSHIRGLAFSRVRGAVIGTRTANALKLQLLEGQNTGFVNSTFSGVAKGDSLIGSFTGLAGQVVYVRAGK